MSEAENEIAALRAEVARLTAARARGATLAHGRLPFGYALAIAGALTLFIAAYLASPLYALHELKAAARSGDKDRLEQLVDFPRVRENLKATVSAYVLKSIRSDPQMSNNPFAGLGALLVPALADRAIDTFVTPDGIAAMVNTGNPPRLNADATSEPPPDSPTAQFSYSYIDLNRFKVNLARPGDPRNQIALILERHGLFEWKLIRIDYDFPASQPQQDGLASGGPAPKLDSPTNIPDPSEGSPTTSDLYTPPPPDVAKVSPQDAVAFSRYRAEVYSGPIVPPDFNGRDRSARTFRTRIMEAVHGGPVFAGRLALSVFGCGTDCSMGYAIDVSTGQVFDLPVGGEDQPDLNLRYVKDSSLLRANWSNAPADSSGGCVYEDFIWAGRSFRPLGPHNDPRPCPEQP